MPSPAQHPLDEVISTSNASEILGRPRLWVERQIKAGALPGKLVGRTWCVYRPDVVDLRQRRMYAQIEALSSDSEEAA